MGWYAAFKRSIYWHRRPSIFWAGRSVSVKPTDAERLPRISFGAGRAPEAETADAERASGTEVYQLRWHGQRVRHLRFGRDFAAYETICYGADRRSTSKNNDTQPCGWREVGQLTAGLE